MTRPLITTDPTHEGAEQPMRDFNADVEDEIERVGSMMERQMEREAARYEQRIRDLESAVLEAQGAAADAFHEGFGEGIGSVQDEIAERVAAAEARGYDRAIANLLDSPRYMAWHKGTQDTPFPAILTTWRQHQEIARYLEAQKEPNDAV